MSTSNSKEGSKHSKRLRVSFRRNRQRPARKKDFTQEARDAEGHEIEAISSENIAAKGDLSRRRTITIHNEEEAARRGFRQGTVVAVRGLYSDVDESGREFPCTVRRILRTRLITERNPIAVGDRVNFSIDSNQEGVVQEGVIESVEERSGHLCRRVGKRIHTIVANIEQAIVVSSAGEPPPKANLIDRYIVAALHGEMTPIVCMNKVDLDKRGAAREVLQRYADLGYNTVATSAITGEGVEKLRELFKDKASVVAGQSGVGKSSLLNQIQPGLNLKIGDIVEQTQKGRHTTTTARLIRLKIGGFVVDTPGVRSFDLSIVPRNELEVLFVEFVKYVPDCKFPDCTHTHEIDCAVKAAVESGAIHTERYESYVKLFENPE